MPNRHTVLEVRPLRALRPMLSPSNDFCALNLYQLALMSTLSYSDFGQQPSTHPVETDTVSFPLQPSVGNWFGDALPKFEELWKVDAAQTGGKAYYPLYEEVPYSKRLEVVPFDPVLYPEVNSPSLGKKQETPASIHFFDDTLSQDRTDTQAFIAHHDSLILLSIRGTASGADALRDMDAHQVPFKEGSGKVHNGFYGSAVVAYDFAVRYLEKFYNGQKLIITGHSLGGAIALLVAEMLRNRSEGYDIVVYTYGAPRAGDEVFVKAANALVHHRIVNHNDPVVSVPATWMNTSTKQDYIRQGLVTVVSPEVGVSLFVVGMVNITGEPYAHHGVLRHFMPVYFEGGIKSSLLWKPGCSTINDHGCALALRVTAGLPGRDPFLRQVFDNAHHKMGVSYIPNCWASLRRWQAAYEGLRMLVTDEEFSQVEQALEDAKRHLRMEENRLAGRPDKYREAHAREFDALRTETGDISITSMRLRTLRDKPVTERDVYGEYAGLPQLLEDGLPRWKAHAENSTGEQLAMIPHGRVEDERALAELLGRPVRRGPYDMDIDSIV